MTQRVLTASIICAEAVRVLDNELVMGRKVFRGYDKEFKKNVNGYKVGSSVTIKRPADFTVREGAVMDVQQVNEGDLTLTVDRQRGIDFQFTSEELTMDIDTVSERVIKPAMVQLANHIDADLHSLYKYVPNWVGTPGQTINSFADFAKGPERMDEMAVPGDGRCSVLNPSDTWGLLGAQTSLYSDSLIKPAYRNGTMGMIGNVDNYSTQNAATHTNGAFAGTVLIDQALTASTISYDDVKSGDFTQTIHVDGLTSATAALKAGDTFTIDGVYDVNPVTKEKKPYLKMFCLYEDATAAGNEVDLTVYPALIWSGAFQNVWIDSGTTDLNDAGLTFVGSASTAYRQSMMFHTNAFALVTVPMIKPPGAAQVARKSYKGLSVRLIPVYNGVNDTSAWRLDVLYGRKVIDPRLAVRVSGTG